MKNKINKALSPGWGAKMTNKCLSASTLAGVPWSRVSLYWKSPRTSLYCPDTAGVPWSQSEDRYYCTVAVTRGMTKRQTTAIHHKPPQTTANHHKPPQTTTHHRKPPQTTTRIWDDNTSVWPCAVKKRLNHRKPPQTTSRTWVYLYSCAGEKQVSS